MDGIEIRTAVADDVERMFHVDGRNFGFSYTPEMIADGVPTLDLSRFRHAWDGDELVGVAGSFALDVTLPGGSSVPMGGVTWVSVSATHRRRGILTRLMDAVHADIDERGEPVASLGASESAIYERFGYGAATVHRSVEIHTRGLDLREAFRPPPGTVRFMDAETAHAVIPPLWERYRRTRSAEVTRTPMWHEFLLRRWSLPDGDASPVHFLRHADGYAAYRVAGRWNEGFPEHELRLLELVAVTPDAHAALWSTLLGVDLVARIVSHCVPDDDPLPYLLPDPRAVRTVALNDGIWVNVRDPAIAFGARTYGTDDRIVVEVDGRRWAIEGGPDGGSCRVVRSRPDLVAVPSALGPLLHGGVRASTLVAGRRLTARSPDALRRADAFFSTSPSPYCQIHY